MAEPARKYDYDSPRPPQDPFNPIPPATGGNTVPSGEAPAQPAPAAPQQ